MCWWYQFAEHMIEKQVVLAITNDQSQEWCKSCFGTVGFTMTTTQLKWLNLLQTLNVFAHDEHNPQSDWLEPESVSKYVFVNQLSIARVNGLFSDRISLDVDS